LRSPARKNYCSKERLNHMKPATIIGILLIVLGIIGYATGGISFTHEKKVVDAGPVQISHKTQDTLPLSPILSTVSLIAGIGLVVVGARAK
jgi:preprotein translocase subunit Sss1